MKFSVEIETDSHTFESPSGVCPSPSPLQWNIEVEVKQKAVQQPTPQPRGDLPAPQTQARGVQPAPHGAISISQKRSVVLDTKAAGASDILRKLSAMSARGRKVSRQGEWIILSERVGVLTSQNGVQQVRERRVKLGSTDFDKLVELGY